MDFSTLKTRLTDILGRAPVAVVYEMVTADVNNTLRLRVMEATTTVTEGATVSLPSGFLDLVSIYRDTAPRTSLQPTTPDSLQRMHRSSGVPSHYAIEDGQIALSPAPNGSENIVIRYYAALADLSADGDTNDVLTRYPQIYVYGALAHHALLIRDAEAVAAWAMAYEKAKKQAISDDASYRSGAGSMVPFIGAVG